MELRHFTFFFLWMFTDVLGFSMIIMCLYRFLWILMDVRVFFKIYSSDVHGFLRMFTDFHGFLRIFTAVRGFSRILIDFL